MSRKIIIAIMACLMLTVLLVPFCTNEAQAAPIFDSGTGTLADPYIITNANQLQAMNIDPTAHYALGGDIDCSDTMNWNGGTGFTPIGQDAHFSGTLDGRGYTIFNLTIYRPGSSDQAMFKTTNYASIRDLNLHMFNIHGYNTVGTLIGISMYSFLDNISGTTSVIGLTTVGGLVANNYYTTVNNSFMYGTVSGNNYVGGLFGYSQYCTYNNCFSGVDVEANTGGQWAGGFVSYTYICTLNNVYSIGNVRGGSIVGGLVGVASSTNLYHVYSTGAVVASGSNTGGLIGHSSSCTITSSYWDTETSGKSTSSGGVGKTTSELLQQSTYSGWDLTNVWHSFNSLTRPMLRMEHSLDISYPHQLQLMGLILSGSYNIRNDLDMGCTINKNDVWGTDGSSGYGFAPIGSLMNMFTGSLNGNNHSIIGMYFNSSIQSLGIFNFAESSNFSYINFLDYNVTGSSSAVLVNYMDGGSIKNITGNGILKIIYETGGSLAGRVENTQIENCSFTGEVIAPYSPGNWIGGLIGELFYSTVIDSNFLGNVAGRAEVGGLIGVSSSSLLQGLFFQGDVTGYHKIGGIVGSVFGSTISNCTSNGTINASNDQAGGIAGKSELSTMQYCVNNNDVVGRNFTGGIAGYVRGGEISNCSNYGDVLALNNYAGGLFGDLENTAIFVNDSFSQANITSLSNFAGGLVGRQGNYSSVMQRSYSAGNVSASGYAGGLVSYWSGLIRDCFSTADVFGNTSGSFASSLTGATVENSYAIGSVQGSFLSGFSRFGSLGSSTGCFYDINSTGVSQDTSGIATGKTTVQMMTISTFSSWDFVNVWAMRANGSYPYLLHPNYSNADAGPDLEKPAGSSVTLNGSRSMGPISNWTWSFTYDSNPVTLYGEAVSHTFSSMGTYDVQLTTRDVNGDNWTDSMSLTISDSVPPVADAGPDQDVDAGTTVTFNGSGSSDDVGIANYTWTFTYNSATVNVYGESPTFNFSILGSYAVTLTVKDAGNNSATDVMNVTVNDTSAPTANAGVDQTVDEGTVVTFNASASTDNVAVSNYTWTFTYNGSTVNLYGVSPSFNFSIPGNYSVNLTVMDAAGHNDTDQMFVNVTDIDPVADAGVDQIASQGIIVTFDGSGSYDAVGITNYTWTFTYNGSTVTLYGVSPTFNFSIPGNYSVNLTVKDAAENEGTDTMYVNVTDLDPMADAGVDQTVPAGTIVVFNGSGSYDAYGITNYTWTFTYDNGTVTLYGASPSFNFTVIGNYTVTLTVKDAAEKTGTDTMMVNVADAVPPVADAGPNQTVNQGTLVTFNGSGSTDDIAVTNHTWTFNDGTGNVTLYGVSPQHTFQNAGVFIVTLNVSDAAGNWDVDMMTVTVNDTTAPVANAGIDQTVDEGSVVTFNGSASTDNVGVTNYSWSFTYNGTTVTLYGVAPTFNFSIPGNYSVNLTVRDAVNNTHVDEMFVNVTDIDPVADAGTDQTVDEGTIVTFDGSGSYDSVGIANHTWTFVYDGGTVTLYGVSPTFNFSIPGNYTVTLTVKDAAENEGTDTMSVNVTDLDPVADAGVDQTVDQGTTVTFDGSDSYDSYGIDNFTWTFTYDGSVVTLYGVSPTFNFSITGNYTVTLTVQDDGQNTGTDTMLVNVNDNTDPVADAGIDQTVDKWTVVTFDGSGSNDNVAVTNYTWTFTYNGSTVTLYGVSPTFNFSLPGNYTVTLTVKDAANNVGTDTMMVNVNELWAPTITTSPPSIPEIGSFIAGQPFQYRIGVNESCNFSFHSDAGFLSISADGNVTGVLEYGVYYVNISASSVPGKLTAWQNFTITVVNGTWVNGTVNGPDGTPIVGVEIWIDGVLMGLTDEDGNYSLLLIDGDYQMELVKDGFLSQTIGFQINQDGVLVMDDISLESDDDLLVMVGASALIILIVAILLLWWRREDRV